MINVPPAASLYLPITYAALGHLQRLEIRGEIVLGIQQHVILPHLTHPRWI